MIGLFRPKTRMVRDYTAFGGRKARQMWVADALRLEKDGWVAANEQHARLSFRRHRITVLYARRPR
jgi:hypothetical protein